MSTETVINFGPQFIEQNLFHYRRMDIVILLLASQSASKALMKGWGEDIPVGEQGHQVWNKRHV